MSVNSVSNAPVRISPMTVAVVERTAGQRLLIGLDRLDDRVAGLADLVLAEVQRSAR